MKRLFDIDAETGTREIFHYDELTQQATIETVTDAEPVLNVNKALYNDGDGYSPSRELKRAASIPMGVVLLWHQRYGVDVFNRDHTEKVRRLLNDSEWRYLRTAPGVL